VTNTGGDTLTELSVAGFIFHNFALTGSFNGAIGVAIDSSGHVWVTNSDGNNVTALNNDGTLFGNFAPTGSNFFGPGGVAIDSSGNLWVANFGGNIVTELVGVAAPVLTPMVACLTKTTPATVCLP
jgi:DNA-binding beta-propeller fold protein YncE